jgi:hypothetical protein
MRNPLLCIGMLATALLALPLHGAEPGPALIHSPEIVSESVAREAGINNRLSRRFARVELDFDSLLHPAEPPREGVEPTEFAPLAQSTVTIESFPGEIYRLNGRYVEEWTDSAWTWVGAIEGYEYADLVVSVSESGYFGWYEIETDSNSWFSSPDSFYRGVKESVPLEVTSSTWVRARACNSTGCNAWTPGNQTATYTSGCL